MTDYIIVQAGGKGTRMQKLTRNKPKALVPINNLPMIFHLFKNFPDKKYIIIGDYKYNVLEEYLRTFADVNYQIINANGYNGTCSGIRQAIDLMPIDTSFLLIWSDLVLPENYKLPDGNNNVVGLSKDFPCRWKYENNEFEEEKSSEYGVAGYFIFNNKKNIEDVPLEGEFVRWLKEKKINFVTEDLYKTHEYGLIEEWNKLSKNKTRPFNKIEEKGGYLIKTAIDSQGKQLAKKEINWYKKATSLDIKNIPFIKNYDPLTMEKINGKNIYEYKDLSLNDKKTILEKIINSLKELHGKECIESNRESFIEAYITKTFNRLEKIKNLVPFAKDKYITINNKKCLNVFYCKEKIDEIMNYFPDKFCLIHGDCTFSNMMLKNDKEPMFIDPRGYFGFTELYGDENYDWAKLYYSLFTNYDQFNLKKFDLCINEDSIDLDIESNGWEELNDDFFRLLDSRIDRKQMFLMQAIIWLSLTTYAWEDYDSICGAFYNGILYLQEAL